MVAIELKQWQIGTQLLLDHDVAIFDLRRKETHRFIDNRIHAFRFELRPRRPDCTQKLRNDGVEAIDFGTCDVDRFLHFLTRFAVELFHFSLQQLQMNVERVERIPDLMRDARGQQSQRVEPLGLECLLSRTATLGDVAQNHGVADVFGRSHGPACRAEALRRRVARPIPDASQGRGYNIRLVLLDQQRHDVKIDHAIGRIENLDVATDRPAALGERFPIESAHALVERFAD